MNDEKVQQYSEKLKEIGIQHTIAEHPEFTEVLDVQRFLGLTLSDGLSTLVFIADGKPVALIRRDDCSLDFEKVKETLSVKELRKANEKEFVEITGMPVGAAPVYIPSVLTLLDELLFEKEILTGGSGSFVCSFRYKSEDLKKIPNSKVVSVAIIKEQKGVKGQRLYSAITPSGDGTLHIGNYLGAVKQFIELAKNNECFFQIASLHALSTVQQKEKLEKNVETLVLNELALLGDAVRPGGNVHFCFQPDVFLHTELQSILNNVTPFGLLKRAHAYKDKLSKDVSEEEINLGLFNYPILMAADILIYKATCVPVGKDQKQHVEITRDIAERFNKAFKKNVFPLPEPYIPEDVASVLGTDGKRKMSKSLGNIISIFEPEEVIHKQVMGTYTDPTRKHATDPGHIEGNMVFSYLNYFGDTEQVARYKREYQEGKVSDVEVKEYLFQSLMKTFGPARKRYEELKNNPKLVAEILATGTQKAREVAGKTMDEVRRTVGLVNAYSVPEKRLNLAHGKDSGLDAGISGVVTIDDFAKLDLTVGKVVSASHKEGSDRLIRLVVDTGDKKQGEQETGTRVIFTAVRPFGYTPEDFSGKQFFFITNLAPRKMLDEFSQGMILAVDGADKRPQFVSAEGMPVGAKIR